MSRKKNSAKGLLFDENVRRWYENTCRGSKLNAAIRLRRLNLFCNRTNSTPAELVDIGKNDIMKIEDLFHDHVSWLESQGYAPNYIDGILKSVKSWLGYNYIELKRKIKIANAGVAVRIQEEKVPTKEELKSILNVAKPRARASISLMAFAGLRPQVMGNSDATDGLRISDLPDLVIGEDKKSIHFARLPAMVVVRASLSKTRNKYFTFLPREGCEYVLGYLRKRVSDGEMLGLDSPVIALEKGYEFRGYRQQSFIKHQRLNSRFITTPRITEEIRRAVWTITKARPYVLRAYFDTQLLLAESHGKMTHAYRQFFMGHKGDIEARYTTNKGRLTDEMIADMQRAFSGSEQFLCTASNDNNSAQKREMLLEMWREQAQIYGINPLKIRIERQRMQQDQKTTLSDPNTDDEIDAIKKAIQNAIGNNFKDATHPQTDKTTYESKLVDNEDELVSCIQNGWEVVKELNSGKVLLRRTVGCKDWIGAAHHSN